MGAAGPSHRPRHVHRRREPRSRRTQEGIQVTTATQEPPLLSVMDLNVAYMVRGESCPVLRDVSLDVRPGEALGIVGESGSGKSTLAFSLLRYLPDNGRITSGTIRIGDVEMTQLSHAALTHERGNNVAIVYQEAGSALNPSMRVGDQIAEVFRFHTSAAGDEARSQAVEMLRSVLLPEPEHLARRYPHELSGGQQQRVVIAMALAANPKLLILDEPTTALDATVEAEIVDLIGTIRSQSNTAILLISHNLGLVARICDRVTILYSGRVVEQGTATEVLHAPKHPYTRALVASIPRFGDAKGTRYLRPIPGAPPSLDTVTQGCRFAERCPLAQSDCLAEEPPFIALGEGRTVRCYHADDASPLPLTEPGDEFPVTERRPEVLQLRNVTKTYKKTTVVHDLSLEIREREIFGLVGESGSGKTTLARIVAGLVEPTAGQILLRGRDVPRRLSRRPRDVKRAIQMVFQSPDSTLNPRHSVRFILQRAIKKLGSATTVLELARRVRLDQAQVESKTTRLSGGQKQRVAIGRAFAGSPDVVLLDEPVSALDVSVQASILSLLVESRRTSDASYVFISHDLAVVRFLADRIGVMYLGWLVEVGDAADVFAAPHHPYTEALVSAIPRLRSSSEQVSRIRLTGPMPPPSADQPGCRFASRCPRKIGSICDTEAPPWRQTGNGHKIRCHISPTALTEVQSGLKS
ncbi:dipeptide ABC transporter ATP-binding protein [Planotetraspora sp. A-T 1434]|uniref:ABC transporter ATP-binding protein n=1 Tax=Planotetraspora sp. A-T 1434 TaxID=2979219 RepID=UPI003965B67D